MSFRTPRAVALTLFLVAAAPATLFGQEPITFEASVAPADPFAESNRANRPAGTKFEVRRGEVFVLRLRAKLADGWYTYPLTRRAPDQQGKLAVLSVVGDGIQPLYPILETGLAWKDDKDLGLVYLYHPNPFTWSQELYVQPTAKPGTTVPLKVKINGQVCKTQCRDFEQVLTVPVTIAADESVTPSESMSKRLAEKPPPLLEELPPSDLVKGKPGPHSAGDTSATSATRAIPPKSFLGLVFTAMLGGFLSLLTPCVFPMIPITVSFFLKQSESKQGSATLMATVYSGTIMLVLALGGLALMESLTRVINHWATNFVIAGLFLYFALSLLGWYDITLPSWLQDATSAREGQGGLLGAFFMALTFSIISFACVGPIYGGFLTLSAGQTGPTAQLQRVVAVFAFSAAFASPFFLLALFPGLLSTMPRAGSWMNSVKVVMGFLELAAVVKFLRTGELLLTGDGQFLSYNLAMASYVALCAACSLYLFGLFRLPHDHEAPDHIGVPRLLFSLTFLGLGLYLVPGMFRLDSSEIPRRGTVYAWVDGFLLPDPDDGSIKGKGESYGSPAPQWLTNLEGALAAGRAENRLVFIDFTGVSCTNCKVNERKIFPLPEVQKAFSRHVLLKLYTDTVPAGKKQEPDAAGAMAFRNSTFGSGGLPLYALIRPTASSFEVVGVFGQDKGLIETGDVPAFLKFLGS